MGGAESGRHKAEKSFDKIQRPYLAGGQICFILLPPQNGADQQDPQRPSRENVCGAPAALAKLGSQLSRVYILGSTFRPTATSNKYRYAVS